MHHHDHEAAAGSPCRHAAERSRHAATAIAEAEAACRARGTRLTPIRRRVLEALHATHRPVGAYDIAQVLTVPGERPLAPITIYRALDFLIDHGFVHRLASRNAFIACAHAHSKPSHDGAGDGAEVVVFLICEDCGGVDELASPALAKGIAGMLKAQDFVPTGQILEISGRCAHCGPAAGQAEGAT